MPELLLHIGTHKTGTTSIQRFCGANRDALRQRGIWYPPADVGRFPKHYAHHRIAHAIAGRDDDYDTSDATHFFDRVRASMKTGERCLISAEPMYRHVLPDPDQPTGRQPSDDERTARFVRYAEAVRDCIGEFDVTVLVMVRRQDLFLESLYAEQIMSTGYTRVIETYAKQRRALLDYEARLDVWASVFGQDRISVRAFEPSSLTSPIEQVFVEWLGVDWDDDFVIGRRHNVTPSRTFVEFKRQLNVHGQPVEINNTYRSWIERLSDTIDPEDAPDLGRFYLQPRDRMELLERFAEGNRHVAERFMGETKLFQDDPTRELTTYVDRPRLSDREFRQLTKRLIRLIAEDRDA